MQEFTEHMDAQTFTFHSVHTFFYTVGHVFNAIKNPPEESQHKTSPVAFKHIENLCWYKIYIKNQQLPHHKTLLLYANVSIIQKTP